MVHIYTDKMASSNILCSVVHKGIPEGRFVWVVMGTDMAPMLNAGALPCDVTKLGHVYFFHVDTNIEHGQVTFPMS